jgi:hypothetical protein
MRSGYALLASGLVLAGVTAYLGSHGWWYVALWWACGAGSLALAGTQSRVGAAVRRK